MYDVVIIGAGVVGCAIARELSRYRLHICVIERGEDVCCGTSKANSAIVHAGYDAQPGTLKARLNVRGNAMMDDLCRDLDVPLKRCGSLVLHTAPSGVPTAEGMAALHRLLDKGIRNGVPDLRILNREELYEMEPNLSEQAAAALYAPTGAIICPFTLTIALAENAAANGVEFRPDTQVLGMERIASSEKISSAGCVTDGSETGYYRIRTGRGDVCTRIVVNAAGVYADELHNLVSEHKIHITPRRGEYCLFDHTAGNLVSRPVFQLPTKMGKGVLVTPTVHGNLLIGPTAEDIADKEGTNTTRKGLDTVLARAAESIREVPSAQVITSFAGLRAHEDGGDFVIGEAADAPGFFDAAGIASPGLSSAPAIAEMLCGMITEKLKPQEKTDFIRTRKGIPQVHALAFAERAALIANRPDYANIICRCEMISEGEILDAIRRPVGARSLDGVKRRTRSGMGRCQAGFCSPRVMEILRRELGVPMTEITKCGGGSGIVIADPAHGGAGLHGEEAAE